MQTTICRPTKRLYLMVRKKKIEGTPMDFRTPHEVGERIDEDFEALNFGKGYDHTYILNKKEENELSLCARCTSPKTGIVMECYTTQPGVQLYTGNWMTGNFVGKNGQLSGTCRPLSGNTALSRQPEQTGVPVHRPTPG